MPKSWCWARFSDIGLVVGGGTPKTSAPSYWEDGTIAWITPADLSGYGEKYICHGGRDITPIGLKESSAQLMPQGSVMFSSRAPIGYTVIAANDICTNQGFKSIVPYIIEMNNYIYYYLKAQLSEIVSRASGTTFKEISGTELGKTLISLPPLQEQKRIVAAIEVMEQQLATIMGSLN